MNTISRKSPVTIAVVGYGYWGPNLVRVFSENSASEVVYCCDSRPQRLELLKKRYPSIHLTSNIEDILQDPRVEALVLATPLASHFPLAKKALLAGKHVWIEKPMTENSLQAKELIELATKKKKIIQVDHIFLYTQAVTTMKKMIDKGKVGKLYYFDAARINLGIFQPDNNVIWDLATHDIAIMCYLLGKIPKSVSVTASCHVNPNLEDTAYLSFRFKGNMSAHISISWLSPVKIRRTILAGSKKMIVYDDLETSEKIKVYDSGVSVNKMYKPESTTSGYHYRTGDIQSPALENVEALQTAATHFINCIRTGQQPLTNGNEGLKIVEILEAASKALKLHGQEVFI